MKSITSLVSILLVKLIAPMKDTDSISPVIWLTLFLDSAALGTALPVIPKIMERLVHGNIALAASYYGALIAMSGLLLFFFGPIQASLSDRFGRKRMVITAALGSAVSFIWLAAAPNLLCLFLAQAIYAISGASYPVVACLIGDLSNATNRTKNFSRLSGILTLGFIVGAASGGLLGQCGLNVAMNAAALSCLAAVALVLFFFKERAPISVLHAESVTASASPSGWRHQLKAICDNQLESARFLFSRAALGELALVMVCGDFAFQTFLSTWVLFTTLRFHWTIAQSGASLALEGLFSIVVQIVFLQYALPRWGVAKTLLASLFFDALALVLYNCIDGSLIVVAVIAVHCMGAAVKPTCSAALAGAVDAGEQSKLQGAIGSQSALSSMVASLLGTSCFSYFTSSSAPVLFPGISMLISFTALVLAMVVVVRPHITLLARSRHTVAERS